jgi:hypothetical protein
MLVSELGVTYAGSDTDERGQSSFVEGCRTFILEDLGCALQSTAVLSGGLQSHLDDIWILLINVSYCALTHHVPKGWPIYLLAIPIIHVKEWILHSPGLRVHVVEIPGASPESTQIRVHTYRAALGPFHQLRPQPDP